MQPTQFAMAEGKQLEVQAVQAEVSDLTISDQE